MEVVAEGVESDAALAELRALGCHLAQGFAISPPLGAERARRAGPPASRPAHRPRRGRSIAAMARLVRMDRTGHTTLAEWTDADDAAFEAAAAAFREQLEAGYYAVVSEGEGQARQVDGAARRRRAS